MNIRQALEDLGVMLAFAEAGAWEACPVKRKKAGKKKGAAQPSAQQRSRARKRLSL